MALATEKKRTCENEIRSFKAVSSVRSTHGKIKWSIIVPDILLLNYPNLGLEKEKTKGEKSSVKKARLTQSSLFDQFDRQMQI